MDRHPLSETIASAAIAATEDSALVAAFVPGLANTVLFQLTRLRFGAVPTLGLYAVYREGDATFDAAARLDPAGDAGTVEAMLRRFIRSDECLSKLVEPMAAHVAALFGR